LSVIHSRLGSVLKAQGDVTGATRHFKASVEILTALIRDHGKNASLEWDLDWAKGQLKGFAVDGSGLRFAVGSLRLGGCPEPSAPAARGQHISPIGPMSPIRSQSPKIIPTPDPQTPNG
jgi:hypothetical protein